MEQKENPKIDLYKDTQLIFDEGTRAMRQSRFSLLNKWCYNNWTVTCKKLNLDTDLIPITKVNSKCAIDLNVKCKAIKLVRQNLNDLGFDGDFLDKTIIYNHQNL